MPFLLRENLHLIGGLGKSLGADFIGESADTLLAGFLRFLQSAHQIPEILRVFAVQDGIESRVYCLLISRLDECLCGIGKPLLIGEPRQSVVHHRAVGLRLRHHLNHLLQLCPLCDSMQAHKNLLSAFCLLIYS